MPAGADVLTSYSRFYFEIKREDGLYLQGTYLSAAFDNERRAVQSNEVLGITGAYVVSYDRQPLIMDGGCSVVNLFYNMEKKELQRFADYPIAQSSKELPIVTSMCNGLA